ncbi:10034_t:CDS:2 [Entrophospora sp. SA101]|nr:10034_t:CDS:2 [Entrophospora sp. SA101]
MGFKSSSNNCKHIVDGIKDERDRFGNPQIDKFIKDTQDRNEKDKTKLQIDWIPFKEFKNIKELKKGGEGVIYTAEWIKGPGPTKTVALKCLYNSQNNISKLLDEATIDIITEIMKGGRPYIPTSSSSKEKYNIPKVIADCIKKCWDEDKDKRPDIVTLNNFFKDLLIINKDYKKWKPYREKNDGDDDDVESCCNSCREINITDYVTTQWDLTIPERVP